MGGGWYKNFICVFPTADVTERKSRLCMEFALHTGRSKNLLAYHVTPKNDPKYYLTFSYVCMYILISSASWTNLTDIFSPQGFLPFFSHFPKYYLSSLSLSLCLLDFHFTLLIIPHNPVPRHKTTANFLKKNKNKK